MAAEIQVRPCVGCGVDVPLEVPAGPMSALAKRVLAGGLMCEPCVAAADRADAEEAKAQAQGKIREAWHRSVLDSGVPPLADDFRWPDGVPSVRARQWAGREIKTLTLTGGVGTGKTQLAIAAFRERLRPTLTSAGSIYAPRGAWRSAAALAVSMGASFGSDAKDDLVELARHARVLVLDDLDKARGSEFVGETLFALIDGAIVNQQSLIVTANAPVAELAGRWPGSIGRAIADRLADGTVLNFTGASRRGANRKAA